MPLVSRRPTLPDVLILAGAGAYLGLALAEGWFRIPAATRLGLEIPEVRFDGWAAPATRVAAVGAAAAVAWVALRLLRGRPASGGPDAFLAGVGLILTGLAVVLPPPTAGGRPSPGPVLAAGMISALTWTVGGFLRWRQGDPQRRTSRHPSGFGHP